MFDHKKLIVNSFIKKLESDFVQSFKSISIVHKTILYTSGIKTLSLIAKSDAPYHDLFHTIFVTDVAQEILKGAHSTNNDITPEIWLHFILAAIHHDIGYVKGALKNDKINKFSINLSNKYVKLDKNSSDASLADYHVDRSKIYVRETFGNDRHIDSEYICDLIEMTRFPIPDGFVYKDTKSFASLLRAADLIGQLADVDYHKKMHSLFMEYSEIGVNEKMGYNTLSDMNEKYPSFFWKCVNPYIKEAILYLNCTKSGKVWIENLYTNVTKRDICPTALEILNINSEILVNSEPLYK